MKNNTSETLINFLYEIGLYKWDKHHPYPKKNKRILTDFINNLLKKQDDELKKYLENRNNKLLKEILRELKTRNIIQINQGFLQEIVWEKCKIKLNAKKRIGKAEHTLFNMILHNDKPKNIIERLQNFEEWKLNEHNFRLAVASLLICAYIYKQPTTPVILLSNKKVSSINALIVTNRNNGCDIKAKELMDILELTNKEFLTYIREKFLPPCFENSDQKEFWEMIPDNLVA